LHLAVATIAPLDRIGSRWEQLVIEEGERLVKGGREPLF
jgi:hypothetical protein